MRRINHLINRPILLAVALAALAGPALGQDTFTPQRPQDVADNPIWQRVPRHRPGSPI